MNDFRHSLRSLLRTPAFTLLAVLTLAVGIGANTAIFSVIDAGLLKPIPIPEPDRVVRIAGSHPQSFSHFAYGSFYTWPSFRSSRAFRAVGAYLTGEMILRGAATVRVASVTPEFFDVLAVKPAVGRVFTADDLSRSQHVALISHRLWHTRLEGAADVLSRSVVLDDQTFVVLGVMPEGIDLPNAVDAWVPTWWFSHLLRGDIPMPVVVGRLRQHASAAAARDEVQQMASVRYGRGGEILDGPPQPSLEVRIDPFRSTLAGRHAVILMLIAGGAFLVLIVACANIANLMFTRVSVRQREFAVRRALGASNGDLARQILTESALLALAAGAAALLASSWTVDAVRAYVPLTVYGVDDIRLDGRAIAATFAFSIVTALVFSAGPMWSIRDLASTSALRGAALATVAPIWRRVRSGLAISEIAIAVVLVAGAVTVVRTVAGVLSVDLGVRSERILVLEPVFPSQVMAQMMGTAEQTRQYFERIAAVIRQTPGIEEVALASAVPGLPKRIGAAELILYGEPVPAGAGYIGHEILVSSNYFSAIGIQLVSGRLFSASDHFFAQKVAIVSEAFVRRFNLRPDQIVGRSAVLNHRDVQIVGVVKDVRHAGPEHEFDAAAYVPIAQRAALGPVHFIVKTFGDPVLLTAAVRSASVNASRDGLTYNVMTFDDIRETYIRDRRFVMTMMLWFGGLALTLAILGLYGVISYLVHLRTREIGVRVALGASALEIRAGVLARAAKHSLAGVTIGTAIALALSHVLGNAVQNLGKPDALTLAIVGVTIVFVSGMAAWVPAHRATRIDPVQALRFE